jgi:dTDP-4-dehydrorhamnose 3,5-epimerase
MIRLPVELPGLILIAPDVHGDDRGFFVETFRVDKLEALGIQEEFVQDNHARSARGTLRGLHFQVGRGQAKLVRAARGSVLDVVVDIRRNSPTFGRHMAVELDDIGHHQLFVPVGFAHGYLVLSDIADVCYKVTGYYDPAAERGIAWDDPVLGIRWPVSEPILSPRDRTLPTLASIAKSLPDWQPP